MDLDSRVRVDVTHSPATLPQSVDVEAVAPDVLVEKLHALLGVVLDAACGLDFTIIVHTSDPGDHLGERLTF